MSKPGDRKFYDFPSKANGNGNSGLDISDERSNELARYINQNIIGQGETFNGPFGRRKVLYCDYIASGKSLKFIEDFITDEVLPHYGNTHTTTSVTSLQTTLFRHESRDIIRNAVNASEHDSVIFTGSGCTGAIHQLVNALKPTLESFKVTLLASVFEHHSNLLPWREAGVQVVLINENIDGSLDLVQLENELIQLSKSGHKIIGSFCAASNITGQLNDDLAITALLHKYNALSFWDYATAAPYVVIDMNPKPIGDDGGLCRKDAIFFSMHKFVGGVQTPGILIVKKDLISQNVVPTGGGGGGAVFFVTEDNHRFLKEAELREEAGTPAIVESIRAGMVMQLKKSVGEKYILGREHEIMKKVRQKLSQLANLILLGGALVDTSEVQFLPVLSFLIRAPSGGGFLHHNFVCALLNDLFGIQARGGCACSGPYAQRLLGLSPELSKAYEKLLLEDDRLDRKHLRRGHSEYSQFEILRPGFCRLNLPWFASDEEIDFIFDALKFIAKEGWKLMPQYIFNNETAEWKHHTDLVFKERKWLGNISYQNGKFEFTQQNEIQDRSAPNLSEMLAEAASTVSAAAKAAQKMPVPDQTLVFANVAQFRWLMLPSEAKELLSTPNKKLNLEVPFTPKTFKKLTEAKHHEVMGSYLGPGSYSEDLPLSFAGVKQPFVLRDWFTKISPVVKKDFSNVIEDEVSNSSVLVEVRKPDEPVEIISDGASCPIVNGIQACILPGGKRSDPPATLKVRSRWRPPTKDIFRPFLEAVEQYKMIQDGDRVLVCLSGGKDSLSLLHTMRQYQIYAAKANNIKFDLGALTVDPQSAAYDPRPLIPYLAELGVPYLYESQNIMEQAKEADCSSICAFCSRMKRGRMYAAARREGYNVLALGQHLDDLAESFLMSTFHNGRLRTMKANYCVAEGDLRVVRPFVYVREKQLRDFAETQHLPVIAENCPACFESPKERHRTKQVLAQQELLFPKLYWSLKTALQPLMNVRQTGIENVLFGKGGNSSNQKQRVEDDLEEDDNDI